MSDDNLKALQKVLRAHGRHLVLLLGPRPTKPPPREPPDESLAVTVRVPLLIAW